MTHYLVAIHHPDDYDPSREDEAMIHDIHALNAEMEAAGARFFAGGWRPLAWPNRCANNPAATWRLPTDPT